MAHYVSVWSNGKRIFLPANHTMVLSSKRKAKAAKSKKKAV